MQRSEAGAGPEERARRRAGIDPPRRPVQLVLLTRAAEVAARIAAALDGDAIDAALSTAENGETWDLCAPGLTASLRALAATLTDPDPERLATWLVAESARELAQTPPAVREAAERAAHRQVARSAEALGLHAVGRTPVGFHWLRGGELERAGAALARAVAAGVTVGASLVFLGNLARRAGDLGQARELYRRAFARDPGGIDPEWLPAIEDPAVLALMDDAAELSLAPAAHWVPLLGHAAGLFALPAVPEGQGESRAFHEAWAALRAAPSTSPPVLRQAQDERIANPASPPILRQAQDERIVLPASPPVLRQAQDERIMLRRRMKGLAPALFERLRDEGRL